MNYEELIKNLSEKNQNEGKKGETKEFKKIVRPSLKEDVVLRLLPNLENPNGTPFAKVFIHKNFVNEEGKTKVYRCLGKGCPMCAHGKEAGPRFKARVAFLWNAVKEDGEVVVLEASNYLNNLLLETLKNELKEGHNPLDLNSGRNIKITTVKVNDDKTEYVLDLVGMESKVSNEALEFAKKTQKIENMFTTIDREKAKEIADETAKSLDSILD